MPPTDEMRATDVLGDDDELTRAALLSEAAARATGVGAAPPEPPRRSTVAAGEGAVHGGVVIDPLSDPLIGAVVAERYRIERRLGEGGIGRVYRAVHEQLRRPIALKLLHPELSGRKDMHLRFEREARAASRLNHPGSVTVYDFGSWNGMLYLAMELVEGRSLDDIILNDSPLPLARLVDLGAQICDALAAAHAIGLLHRDLKPENVLVARSPDGREHAKICDYGLAYLMGDESQNAPRLTREGTVAGTPTFMAPEQVLNRALDQRTDLYALGCVLYEMTCGKVPFDGSGPMEILTRQLYDEPDLPSRRALQPVSRELERVIMWTLQKQPAKRPQSASELKAALLAALDPGNVRSDRPSSEEVQALFDREARAGAAGIAAPPVRTTADFMPTTAEIVVVASADGPFDQSAVAVLRAQGSNVRSAPDFESAMGSPSGLRPEAMRSPSGLRPEAMGSPSGLRPEAIVVDVRGDAQTGLRRLAEALARLPWLGRATIVVVGPDDDFAVMARALELQSAEYVPASLIATLPRKLHRALERARRNKT